MNKNDQEKLNQNVLKEPVNGDFNIRVSNDKLAVYLYGFNFSDDGEAITSDLIQARLKSKNITYGIDEDKINAIVFSLPTKLSDEELCIAKGVTPVDGEDDDLVWIFSERYLRQGCAVVLPGEIIATYKDATKGTSGKTVYGKEISVSPGANRRLHIGGGIKTNKVENGDEYFATNLGVISTEKDHSEYIQVDSLLQVFDGDMEAYMDIYAKSASGKDVTYENVMDELSQNEITQGIDHGAIQLSLNTALNLSSKKLIDCIKQVLVARGT